MAREEPPQRYKDWTHDRLVSRVELLEKQLRDQTAKYKTHQSSAPRPTNRNKKREFDPSKYTTRLIALKFAYLGQRYNGLEYHANNPTPLPTVEEVLWKALMKACLIFPAPVAGQEVNWEGCEYSKCGRTDKGVSAFGQVVGLRVRSNRPRPKQGREELAVGETVNGQNGLSKEGLEGDGMVESLRESDCTDISSGDETAFDPIADEINYPQVLNRLLPPDIRVLAWCGELPKNFSARFSCKGRAYKYFFTQPAFSPTVVPEDGFWQGKKKKKILQSRREGWLDIEAMQKAARSFEGLHDFRNFCKIDPSKQTENFVRKIYSASIDEIEPHVSPMGYLGKGRFSEFGGKDDDFEEKTTTAAFKVYAFTIFGSAFLWHQVRHVVAILFLIGQGLEEPGLVKELLDVQKNPQKPNYAMADDTPLVLYSCLFPDEGCDGSDGCEPLDSLQWVSVGDQNRSGPQIRSLREHDKYGSGGLVDQVWTVWRQRKMDELLAGSLMDVINRSDSDLSSYSSEQAPKDSNRDSQKLFTGGDSARLVGKYVPVLEKPRMESVEIINARYLERRTPSKGSPAEARSN
ncbi:MAG: hypothetical protein Q9195_003589 [Heterodermia aff. obscurata]